jgi:hypothetical protein
MALNTASDLFDTYLPLGINCYPERVKEINAVFAFKIEGEGGGEWVLDCTTTPPKMHKGTGPNPAVVTIEMDHEDFKRILVSHNAGLELYCAGKIRITGDTNQANKLGLFFEITRPEAG